MEHKILIVGTVPYNEKSTSRAFASYFTGMERENLAQVFSNTKAPVKGHCATLYQITDQRLLKRCFHPKTATGRVYDYEQLADTWPDDDLEVGNAMVAALYRLGGHKNALTYWARKFLWKKKYWCTPEFNCWLERFDPDCVFLSFSDDFFIPQIALYIGEKFDIPILSSIGDDYYFSGRTWASPLYHLYKQAYRKLIRRVFAHGGSAIYIGDKIREQYNGVFGLKGETVYLASSVPRRPFRPIDPKDPRISYFGNIRCGRNRSLLEIANALGRIDPKYHLDIYSNEQEPAYYRLFLRHPNVRFHGSIPYDQVREKMSESDILVIVEGFRRKDVEQTRYSLSTKVADSLSSGAALLAYGSGECGTIGYAASTGCVATCTEKEKLEETIRNLLLDVPYQHRNYRLCAKVANQNHRLRQSTGIFQRLVDKVCKEYQDAK